jgi:hypothetical protein
MVMDIKNFLKKEFCVQCKTEEESKIINELIVKEGGRSLHSNYSVYKEFTCYYLLDFPSNTYAKLEYFKSKKKEVKIILASDIIGPTYYSII